MKNKISKLIIFIFVVILCITIYNHYQSPSTYFEPITSNNYKFTKITPFIDEKIDVNKNLIYCSTFQTAWNKLCDNITKEPCKLNKSIETVDKLNKFRKLDALAPENSFSADTIIGNVENLNKANDELKTKYKINKLLKANITENSLIIYSNLSEEIKFDYDFDYICRYPYFVSSMPIKAFGIEYNRSKTIHYQLANQLQIIYNWPYYISDAIKDHSIFPLGPISLPTGFILKLKSKNENLEIIVSILPPKDNLLNTFNDIKNIINHDYKEYIQKDNSNEVIINQMQKHIFSLERASTFQLPEIKFNIAQRYTEIIGGKILNFVSNNNEIGEAIQIINFDLTMNGQKIKKNDLESCIKSSESVGNHHSEYIVTKPFIIYIRNIKSQYPYFMAYICNTELIVPNEFAKINNKGEYTYNIEDSLDKSDQE